MADKKEIHPAVELLLARMESHPEEFMTSEKAYQQEDSRVRKMSSMYGDILNRASEEEAALLRAAMNKIQLGILHKDLMEELLNGDERRRKEAEAAEHERSLMRNSLAQKQLAAHQTAVQRYQNAIAGVGTKSPSMKLDQVATTHIVGAGPSLKAGITTQPEPTLSTSAINQIKQALGIKK